MHELKFVGRVSPAASLTYLKSDPELTKTQ